LARPTSVRGGEGQGGGGVLTSAAMEEESGVGTFMHYDEGFWRLLMRSSGALSRREDVEAGVAGCLPAGVVLRACEAL
jgi:hypothetical protein